VPVVDRCPGGGFLQWDLVLGRLSCYSGDGIRRWQMPIVIEITAGMLLAFFWAFWVFAFGGWWCGGGC
jgi:hypothetical protein